MKVTIALNRCPHGFTALSFDYNDGGTRFTSGKCCGSWTVTQEWGMSARSLRELSTEALNLADMLDGENQ